MTTRPTMDDLRTWIIDMIRNDYDAAPSEMSLRLAASSWEDGAPEIADKILSRLTLPAEEVAGIMGDQNNKTHGPNCSCHICIGIRRANAEFPTTHAGEGVVEEVIWQRCPYCSKGLMAFHETEGGGRVLCDAWTAEIDSGEIETYFRKWWREECRFGMTETEAVASFTAALSPSKPAPAVSDPSLTEADNG